MQSEGRMYDGLILMYLTDIAEWQEEAGARSRYCRASEKQVLQGWLQYCDAEWSITE